MKKNATQKVTILEIVHWHNSAFDERIHGFEKVKKKRDILNTKFFKYLLIYGLFYVAFLFVVYSFDMNLFFQIFLTIVGFFLKAIQVSHSAMKDTYFHTQNL